MEPLKALKTLLLKGALYKGCQRQQYVEKTYTIFNQDYKDAQDILKSTLSDAPR